MNRSALLAAIIIGTALFIGGMSLKGQHASSTKRSTMELAVYQACTAVRKMDMFPGNESRKEADHAIARLELIAQTHTDQDIATNMTFVLQGYQSAIEAFKKDPTEQNLNALRKLEHDVAEIRESVRPQ